MFFSVFSDPSWGSVGGRTGEGVCLDLREQLAEGFRPVGKGQVRAQGQSVRSRMGEPSIGPPQVFPTSVPVVAGPEGMEVQGRPERQVE